MIEDKKNDTLQNSTGVSINYAVMIDLLLPGHLVSIQKAVEYNLPKRIVTKNYTHLK